MVEFYGAVSAGRSRTLTIEDFAAIGHAAGIDPLKLMAIVDIEATGDGYLPDGRPKILFEAHVFSRLTERKFDSSHPALSSRKWDRALYWGGAAEYVRLAQAMELDTTAALKSTSWAAPQIMGMNHDLAGYESVTDMVEDLASNPRAQIEALCAFIENTKLTSAVAACDWTAFARGYNGPAFWKNAYHFKIGVAWASRAGLVSLHWGAAGPEVENLQKLLDWAGHDPGAIDGALGPKTSRALLSFQKATRKPYPLYEAEEAA